MTSMIPSREVDTTTGVPTVTATIDGYQVTVPQGTLIIRAAELIGIEIPRFCDHPLLDPVAMCRMCLVEVSPGPPKPQPACAVPLADGMEVKTQQTSAMADAAQQGVMEFILANHPLDCPICDKGGECPLQNQAMTNGRGETRYTLPKAHFDKPIQVSDQILLDRERCVNCARCTRFADQIAGDPFIALLERGNKQQVGINPDFPFDSYFSGNTVQICPVGALTSARYRFRSRPFDLVSVPTVCEHCASGCALRTDYRRGTVMRRQAWEDSEVNEDWNCDKGRFAFPYLTQQRLEGPLVREDGQLRPASWPEAIDVAAKGLAAAHGRAAVLTGGRLTVEDAFAYAAFARGVLGSDNLDFRARASSTEEAQFLAGQVAGTGRGVSYADLEQAGRVILVAFEPEDESPIVFLRLRKAARDRGVEVISIAPYASAGLAKMSGRLVPAAPGDETAAWADLAVEGLDGDTIVLVGERAALVPGLLAAVATSVADSEARLAWIPRRAGERGALEAGVLPGLLPGGHDLVDDAARAAYAAALEVSPDRLPAGPGLDGPGIVAALLGDAAGRAALDPDESFTNTLEAVVVAGVEVGDLPDPARVREALTAAPFLVSLETRGSEVTELADVVLPVAVVTEKAGTYLNWEGRARGFEQVFDQAQAIPDGRVLGMLADAIAAESQEAVSVLGRGDLLALREMADRFGRHAGARSARPLPQAPSATPTASGVRLATWRQLIDMGVMQAGEPYLAATARPPVLRASAATASRAGLADGDLAAVSTEHGSITLPLEVTPMPDDVVWLPAHSPGSSVISTLSAQPGDTVSLARGGDES